MNYEREKNKPEESTRMESHTITTQDIIKFLVKMDMKRTKIKE